LANALSQSGRSKEALELLTAMPDPGAELGARRLYLMLELSRPDPERVGDLITQLRSGFAESTWFANALMSAGNMYLLRNDEGTAARFYGELADRFPKDRQAPYANWKAGWLQYHSGSVKEAKTRFERQMSLYPASAEVVAALYWRGRIAEDEHDAPKARGYYIATAHRFQNEYYSGLARERLKALGATGPVADDAELEFAGDPPAPRQFVLDPPEDNLQVQKSMLLENCGLTDFAARELQSAASKAGPNWTVAEMLKVYTDSGDYDRALQTLKRAAPGYYALSFSALPRPFWEGLFPRPYWEQLKQSSVENRLNPFLVASLIRQESEFNPEAISHAQAMGLMQLLPKTGKKLAHELKIRRFDYSMLLDPRINLQLGTRYLRSLLDKYDGHLEYALAAYNAGPEHVDDWKQGHFRDMPEFVESIPFTETREYVEAILRNQQIYSQLYHTP
jgi:soluble lytic murein transglycosylase